MFDNDIVRFTLLVVSMFIASWALRQFFKGWRAMQVDDITTEDLLSSSDEDPAPPEAPRAKFRPVKDESFMQQELEAPIPDELMAEPAKAHHDISQRIQHDTQSMQPPKRPGHKRPHRGSKPSRGRKIQL